MATEDIFIPGKFTDLTDKHQLFLLNELLLQMLNRLNQTTTGSIPLSGLVPHELYHTIQSQGLGVDPIWEENVVLNSLILIGLTASQPVVTTAGKLLASVGYTGVGSLRDFLDLETSNSPNFSGLTIGIGGAAVDYTLNFNGEHTDGVVTWMEDEDYFQFEDDLLIPGTERIHFGDTSSSIRHDGTHLNVVDDHTIALGAPIVELGRNTTEDTTLNFMGDHNDGSIVWMEDENYFDFEDTVRAPSIHLDNDVAGLATTTTFTGVTDTPTADPGWAASSTIDMTVPDAYIKIYIGTQAYVIPAWLT